MATSTPLSQPGPTGLSAHQMTSDKSTPSSSPAAATSDALQQLLQPGRTGVFNPDAQFEAKKYSKPEDANKTADMPSTEEFHDSAMEVDTEPNSAIGTDGRQPTVDDDDDNTEATEEEKAEREAMLRAGAENAAKQASQTNKMPLPIAVEIDKASKLFRAAFAEGQSTEIMAEFKNTNENIRGINKKLGNTYKHKGQVCYDRHMMSEGIFAHIDQLRNEIATLLELKAKGKSGSNDPEWVAHNKQVVTIALAARKPLTEMSLSWRSITPDLVWATVEESFSQALPLMDADVQRVAFALLHLEWQKPTRSQEVACAQGLVPMQSFFQSMELGDTGEAMKDISKLAKVNEDIVEVNKACDNVRAPEDHIIPIDFFNNVVDTYNKTSDAREQAVFLDTARALLAAFLETLGYDDIASSMPPAPAVNTTGDDLRGVKADANKRLLQWRGSEYSENVRSLMRKQPAAPPATNETLRRDTTGPGSPRDEPEQVADSIFVGQSEPEYAPNATSSPQPGAQHSSALGFKAQSFRGPVVEDRTTMWGYVVGSRGLSRGASRHILNIGTKSVPIYKCFPGATFGRGTGADWVKRYPLPQARDIRERKATEVYEISGIATVETESKGRNHPITYFPVSWKGEEQVEWLTRSELLSVCGKTFVAEAINVLSEGQQCNLVHFEAMKQSGLHPDTKQPLTDADIAEMPWLAPRVQDRKDTSSNTSIPKAGSDDNSTAHIKLGTARFGAPKA